MTNTGKSDASSPSSGAAQNSPPEAMHPVAENSEGSELNKWIEKFKKGSLYAFGAMALLVLGTVVDVREKMTKLFPEPDLREIVKQLASDSPEVRIVALSELQVFESRKQSELQLGLVAVQELLARRVSTEIKKKEEALAASKREAGMAMQALSNLLKQADKHHTALQRPVLSRVDLSDLDLSGLYLRGTVWQDVNALNVRLVDTDLQGAIIDGSQLTRADASKADLVGATLKRVCLEGASLAHTKLGKARIVASDLNVASLRQADLSAAVLRESRMAGADLTGAILTGADLGTVTEWLPEQTAQAGMRNAALLPTTYLKVKLGICG